MLIGVAGVWDGYEGSDRYFIVAVLERDPETAGMALQALRDGRVVAVNFSTLGELSTGCDHIRPRVVLLDLTRPDEDAIDMVRMLRAHDVGGSLSIVAVGTASQFELPVALCELIDCYIPKPANWATVTRAVINLATGRRPPSTGVQLMRGG